MQRSIGVCLCWSDLEKRRKAIDLFVQRQLEVVDGIPKKVFYECGATPTNCKYNVTAVRNETTGHFELFEMGEHSHPVRANISSGFLVDQTTPSCAQSLTQTVTYSNKHIELPSSDDQSKISTQDEKPTTKDQKSCFDTSKHKSLPNPERVLPPKKVLKLTQSNIKIRDFSTESLKSEMTSTTNSPDVLWTSKRKLPAAKKSFNGAENQASLIFDNSFDECIGLLTEDSSKLDTSPVQMEEELKVQMEEEPKESTITISTTNNDENKLINSQVVSSSNSLDIQPIEQQNVYLDDSFMPDLHKYLSKWRQRGIFKLVQIDFHKRFLGQFVNLNCLVFSVIVPSQGLPVYLQICDGTKLPAPTKSINTRENCSQVQSALFDGNLDYENVREYFQVISCFDEFAEQAKTIQAGDIIQARNVHARTFFYPYHTFTLRGLNGQQNPFNRGIQLLARKGKTLFKEKRTIVMKNSI